MILTIENHLNEADAKQIQHIKLNHGNSEF